MILLAALAGCAPAAYLRPPAPVPTGSANELGAGLAWSQPAISGVGVIEGVTEGLFSAEIDERVTGTEPGGLSGQVWYARSSASGLDGGGMVAFGATGYGAGGWLRWLPLRTGAVRGGVQVAGGYLWASIDVPVAVRLGDQIWVYTAPGFGLRLTQRVRIPAGVSFEVHRRLRLNPEFLLGFDAGWGLQLGGAFGAQAFF